MNYAQNIQHFLGKQVHRRNRRSQQALDLDFQSLVSTVEQVTPVGS